MLHKFIGLAQYGSFNDARSSVIVLVLWSLAGLATLDMRLRSSRSSSRGLRAASTVFFGRYFSFCRLTVTDFLRVGLGTKVWNIAAGPARRPRRAPGPGRLLLPLSPPAARRVPCPP